MTAEVAKKIRKTPAASMKLKLSFRKLVLQPDGISDAAKIIFYILVGLTCLPVGRVSRSTIVFPDIGMYRRLNS